MPDESASRRELNNMLADFFTKPLQGSLFRKFRAVLLGHDHINSLDHHALRTTPEERVGNEKSLSPALGSLTSEMTYATIGSSGGDGCPTSSVVLPRS